MRRAFTGGPIHTMDAASRDAEVVITSGGRISAVGPRAMLEAERSSPDLEVVELGGRHLLPGFIDAHNHLCIAALHPCWADLSAARSMGEVLAALGAQAAAHPEEEWVRGFGWNEARHGVFPRRGDLDALGLDRPVLVASYTLHQGVVSSRGLDVLGIGGGTADPPGGRIGRDRTHQPDGLLVERAWSQAHGRSLAAYADRDRWMDHIEARAKSLTGSGITAVHDAACPPEAEELYRALAAAGRLGVSVLAMPHPRDVLARPDQARLDGPPTGEGDEQVRVGPLKLFADGGVTPAVDFHVGGNRLRFGEVLPGLAEDARAAADRGFRIAVHAIGNAGLEAALEVLRDLRRRRPGQDHRFRVEHATLARPDQVAEMASLGAVAVVQPGFLHHMGEAVEGVVPEDATWLPFGSLSRAGVALAASSDDPCTFHEPVRTCSHGATRITGSGGVLDPGEAVTYEDWLAAYTSGAAFAGGQEAERGRLAPGMRADLVVLEGDLDPHDPPRVAQTWVAGELVFSASQEI